MRCPYPSHCIQQDYLYPHLLDKMYCVPVAVAVVVVVVVVYVFDRVLVSDHRFLIG